MLGSRLWIICLGNTDSAAGMTAMSDAVCLKPGWCLNVDYHDTKDFDSLSLGSPDRIGAGKQYVYQNESEKDLDSPLTTDFVS